MALALAGDSASGWEVLVEGSCDGRSRGVSLVLRRLAVEFKIGLILSRGRSLGFASSTIDSVSFSLGRPRFFFEFDSKMGGSASSSSGGKSSPSSSMLVTVVAGAVDSVVVDLCCRLALTGTLSSRSSTSSFSTIFSRTSGLDFCVELNLRPFYDLTMRL